MSESAPRQAGQLSRNALGVPGIVFLVLAAVAPLTVTMVVTPLGIAFGNGAGMAGAFVLALIALLLFAVGYAKMSQHVVNAGAFYAYVTRAVGPRAGVATAYLAVLGYNTFLVGATATSGFFFNIVFNDVFGIDVSWQVWSVVTLVGILFLGRRGIDVSAKILGVALMLEVTIVLIMDISILVQEGWHLSAFKPSEVFGSGLGIGLLFAGTAFLGFEATALFAEEARNPLRTIPRATYTALALMGVFHVVTALSIISAVGVAQVQGTAAKDPAGLVFGIGQQYLGSFLFDVMQVLLLVSLSAAYLALHNAATRYLFALGRARLLPSVLGRTHPRHGSPHVASATQIAYNTIFWLVFVIAGADPILTITPSMTGFGTLAIVALQAAAAWSVVVFFRRRKDPDIWGTAIAPALGGAGLLTVFILACVHFGVLAGSDSAVIGKLPWVVLIVVLVGFAVGQWLKTNRPERYAHLGREGLEQGLEPRDDLDEPRDPVAAAAPA
jgi:amino acid transporter